MTVSIDGTAGVTTPSIVSTTETFVNTPAVTAAQSMVQVQVANGYGSTNTVIRRFTNVITNQGSDITYADSAANGASFTINTNGVYAISFADNFSGANPLGVSLNSTQLTTSISSITGSSKLTDAYTSGVNLNLTVAWTGYLPATSVIRAHTGGAAVGTSQTQFTITRVA